MSLPELAVRRPITISMGTLAVVTFGLLAARRLPVDLLPDLSYPTLTVQTEYPDAAPLSVEHFVTRPVEETVGVIPGVREMRSTSRAGLSEVVLEFEWDEEMDFAALDVREKLGLVQLPREAEPPRVLRFDPSLDPILRVAFSGDRPLDELRQLAERWLKQRLEAVRGVAAVKIRGGLEPEIHVEADEGRLAALGLDLSDLATALQEENVNLPGGTLRDWGAVYLVRTMHEFQDLDQIRRTVVRKGESGRVRVEDVALVSRGYAEQTEMSRLDGTSVVEIALHREGAANTVQVARAVRSELARLQEELPDDLELVVLSDQAEYIEAAVGEVWSAALIGGLLAVLVLYFFLRDPASTLIIGLSIPISVIATFLPMQQAAVSLNIMSLGGLALGIGMLVDNSIVVLEAIDRHRRAGARRAEAAARGAAEVAGAVTASTLTTVSVFFPIVFVQGVAGQLFYDQAVTVCFSLTTSLVVSLTLIPALASIEPGGAGSYGATLFQWDAKSEGAEPLPGTLRLGPVSMPPIGDGRHRSSRYLTRALWPVRALALLLAVILWGAGWVLQTGFLGLTHPLAMAFERSRAVYARSLSWGLRRRWLVIAVAFVCFGGSLAVIPGLGTNLIPDLAQGEFAFRLELPEGTPLDTTSEVVSYIEDALVDDPAFSRVFSMVGSLPSSASGRRTFGENLAQIDFQLPDGSSAEDEHRATARVREVLSGFSSVEAELVRPSVLTVRPAVALRLYSDSLGQLDEAAGRTEEALAGVSGLTDVGTTVEPGSPEVQVELDRERASSLGVTAEEVATALRTKIRGDVVGQFREGEERLDIRLRSKEKVRERASDVAALKLRLPGGTSVPLSAVAAVSVERGPAAIHRVGGARMAEVTAKATASDLGALLERVRQVVGRLELPPQVELEMAGQNEEIEVSFGSLRLALLLAVFLVYIVMAGQFESLLHPFVILMAVPLGVVGVVLALWVTGRSVSVLALIGAVMLAGIVVNNAIVLVDAVNRRRREGQDLVRALEEAGQERYRPIMMTTLTTVLALLPLAVGLGEGSELRAPLAVTVIGGLTVATVLTLLVIPCLYRALSRPTT